MSASEHQQFSYKLVQHSAPTLLGIKCASLISLGTEHFALDEHIACFNARAARKGLRSRILCHCGKRALLFVYQEDMLQKRLAEPWARCLLSALGYQPQHGIEECLRTLANRIAAADEFPHEIGVFLGYPQEDIVGFIANKGENCKLCGCWKVYGCAESAKRTFSNYDKCRKFLSNRLEQGLDLYQALRISS